MKHRLADVPALIARPYNMEAQRFNRVRVALARLGGTLRWQIPTLRGLDVYLDADAWICGDRTLNDFPVVAWTDFGTRDRTGLHASVPCTVSYYHAHAGMIINTVLENIDAVLEERLGTAEGETAVVKPIREP